MSFSLLFWRKKKDSVTATPPAVPGALSVPAAPSSNKPKMPYVRDAEKQDVHPRLQRMAEVLAALPKHNDGAASPPLSVTLPPTPHHEFHHTEPQKPVFWEPPAATETPLVEVAPVRSHESHPVTPAFTERLAPVHHDEKATVFTNHESHAHVALDARASNAFYAHGGAVFWTLGDLGNALVSMSADTFHHHVTADRNDFASWIEGCFTGDAHAFGSRLRGLSREGMLRAFLELHTSTPVTEIPPVPVFHTPAPAAPVHEHVSLPPSPVHEEPVHHDEKAPVVVEWRPAKPEDRSTLVAGILDDLNAARMQAAVDLGGARERFVTTRTHVWSILSEEERAQVLPKLRDTYEYLRSLR